MRILIDSHVLVWIGLDQPKISTAAYKVITDTRTVPQISIASIWELAIKVSLGKLQIRGVDFDRLMDEALKALNAEVLAVNRDHLRMVLNLPFHHRDPFDRILVAQALSENVPLLSADAKLDAYGVTRIW